MSDIIENTENASDLKNRVDDLSAMTEPAVKTTRVIKPTLPVKPPDPEVLIRTVEMQQEAFRQKAAISQEPDGVASLDSLKLKEPGKVDYAHMREEDIYNMDIPMEARPFSSEDSLRVSFLDSGLVPRWVNKDPRRLGSMIARGFQYVTEKDLAQKLEVEVSADAEGHFSLGDVILMKITKERYYPAMRAAHIRALNSVGVKQIHRSAVNNANEYMSKEVGGQYKEEAEQQKVAFYTPGLSI